MGTMHYVYNDSKQAVYELGKLIPGCILKDILQHQNSHTLEDNIYNYISKCRLIEEDINVREWVKYITVGINKTTGIENLQYFTDDTEWFGGGLEQICEYKILGSVYDKSDAIGKTVWDYFCPEYIKHTSYKKCLDTQRPIPKHMNEYFGKLYFDVATENKKLFDVKPFTNFVVDKPKVSELIKFILFLRQKSENTPSDTTLIYHICEFYNLDFDTVSKIFNETFEEFVPFTLDIRPDIEKDYVHDDDAFLKYILAMSEDELVKKVTDNFMKKGKL
jgi:hypothetical protein